MHSTVVTVLSLVFAFAFVSGCQSRPAHDETPEPVSRRDLLNMDKLENVPAAVRNEFNATYLNAGVTSVEFLDAATGVALYEVNFLQNHQPRSVIYRPDGTVVKRTPVRQ
jgi:hypothetical protein